MRKSRSICILVTIIASMAAYVAWSIWNPAPAIESMAYDKNVDANARSAAEADFRSHPPKARKLTWDRFLDRVKYPYRRESPSPIPVAFIPYTDGDQLLSISYPRGAVYLHRRLDGAWGRLFSGSPTDP